MAAVRQTKNGKWELAVRHASLPSGRKYFTFDTREDAERYGEQWALMVKAGLPVPAELLVVPTKQTGVGEVLRAWANSGLPSKTDQALVKRLITEFGAARLTAINYRWAENWVEQMKVGQNLAPSSIRQKVGALARAIDYYQRGKSPDIAMQGNPLRSLPDGYSSYSERDKLLVLAAKKEVREDEVRERRLAPGEHARIVSALRGEKREGVQRPLALPEGDAMLVLYLLILYTGCRLKEAYTLRAEHVDMQRKVLHVQTSKQWRGKVKFRDVPMRPELHAVLSSYQMAGEQVFPFWNGEEATERVTNRLSQRFASAFRYAQLEDLTEHDLRHEATCQWFELRGKDGQWLFRSEEIHRIMGWAPNSKMAGRYASFRGEDLAARLWGV